jgi:hypothetical protein
MTASVDGKRPGALSDTRAEPIVARRPARTATLQCDAKKARGRGPEVAGWLNFLPAVGSNTHQVLDTRVPVEHCKTVLYYRSFRISFEVRN